MDLWGWLSLEIKRTNFSSEKMFKRRITEWKIRKNYKAKEKEVIARKVKAFMDAGHGIHSISFHGRPVKLDRVKRHCRTNKNLLQVWDHLSQNPEDFVGHDQDLVVRSPSTNSIITPRQTSNSSSDRTSLQADGHSETDSTEIIINITPPTDFYTIESTLFHTREAVQWQFSVFVPLKGKALIQRFPVTISDDVKTGRIDQTSEFWLSIHRGYTYLQAGQSHDAWRMFDRCCQMVQPLLASAPLQLLSCLLLHFATAWQGLNELEHHLLDFVSSMTASLLGSEHPLAMAMRLVATADIRNHVVEGMMDLVTAGYKARRKSDNSSLFALRVDQVDMLRKRRKFEQALHLARELVKDSQYMKPKRYRTALAALGRIHADQNEEFVVEGIAHRILDHEASDKSRDSSGGTSSWACGQLASLAINRSDFALATTYLRRAISMSNQQFPNRGPSIGSLQKQLDHCLVAQNGRSACDEVIPSGDAGSQGRS
jgi:hypothetical protein